MSKRPSLTVRRWNSDDGHPGSPGHVIGIPVDHLLATRPDAPGALVALQDRRVARPARSLLSATTARSGPTSAVAPAPSATRPIASGSRTSLTFWSTCSPSRASAERRRYDGVF